MIDKDLIDDEILEKYYDDIYEVYCHKHPEEITSDFTLENANEGYLQEIIEDMRGNYDR